MKLPQFGTYGNYSSSNYGANALWFQDAEGNQYWFSYKTLVAFQPYLGARVVHCNDWSTTTGRHLNAIDGGGVSKHKRVSAVQFERMYQEAFGEKVPA